MNFRYFVYGFVGGAFVGIFISFDLPIILQIVCWLGVIGNTYLSITDKTD